ncbi:MAG: isopentenyl phosphate kinase [Candidatus Promineifilaceae bacterium]
MNDILFLKLGGSLLTDKTGVEAVRGDVLTRLAGEIAAARQANPDLKLLLGHGSGSFGHVAARKYGTRHGVKTAEGWRGFAEVSASAARLNKLVREALLDAGVPVLSLQPSASAVCVNGQIKSLAVSPVEAALSAGLVPLVYGDVAFDTEMGGTIISTEEILSYLAELIRPSWLLLAGETAGVLDNHGRVIPEITRQNSEDIQAALGGSRGTDVTGGMASKVNNMITLAEQFPGLYIRIFSGMVEGELTRAILNPAQASGTRLFHPA